MREQQGAGAWFSGMSGNISPRMPSSPEVLAEKTLQGSMLKDGEEDELVRLRVSLAQREAAFLRLEGENFILSAQVQQLQQQQQETCRDAQACQAQLAQAQQVLDSAVSGRVPLKTDVDHVRAIIASARRSIRRLANSERGQASCLPTLNRLRVAAANANVSGSGEAAKASVNPKPSPRGETRSSPGPSFKDPKARRSPGRSGVSRVSSAGTGGTGSSEVEERQQAFSAPPRPPSPGVQISQSCTVPALTSSDADVGGYPVPASKVEKVTALERPRAAHAALGAEKPSTELEEIRSMFLRQRELLMVALKKGAVQEEHLVTMRDDLIRKDVIIHNLKQEQYTAAQEAQNQQQLFENQMQALQQQHHVQQLQQVQQLHELEALLHQHHQLQQAQQAQQVHQRALEAEVMRSPAPPLGIPVPQPVTGESEDTEAARSS